MENLRWIAAAALSAYACHLAVHHTTPIDAALPFLALVVTFFAWASYPAVMLGVPMLIIAEIAIAQEPVRLLVFGAIVAVACGVNLCHPERRRGTWAGGAPGTSGVPRPHRSLATLGMTAVALLLLLRWIPLDHVLVWRELLLLALAVATVIVLGRTPFAVAVAVITALVTPAVPLRTLALPVAVLTVAGVARLFGMPRIALRWPSTVVLMFAVLFFPWSGVVARAFPYFLREVTPSAQRTPVGQALAANRSVTYEVPHGARTLVVSGANVAHLRRGARLGRIDPGAIPVRIGDAADWGYMRRDHFYAAHNPLPREAVGKIREYGYAAWIDGSGRVALPRGARRIRVTGDASLPAGAALQVEGFE